MKPKAEEQIASNGNEKKEKKVTSERMDVDLDLPPFKEMQIMTIVENTLSNEVPDVLAKIVVDYFMTPFPKTSLQIAFDPLTLTIPISEEKTYDATRKFFELDGASLCEYFVQHSSPPQYGVVEVPGWLQTIAIENLHLKCAQFRKKLGHGPVTKFYDCKTNWRDVCNFLNLQTHLEEEQPYHWTTGRTCCDSTLMATFFLIPIFPTTLGRVDALWHFLESMGNGDATFAQVVGIKLNEVCLDAGDGYPVPWPTVEQQMEFIKSAFPDVLQSSLAWFAPPRWIYSTVGAFPAADAIEMARDPKIIATFNAFTSLLTSDGELSAGERVQVVTETRNVLKLLLDLNHPFYHTFIQFAAKVSAKFGSTD
jgi:hypothetical protein